MRLSVASSLISLSLLQVSRGTDIHPLRPDESKLKACSNSGSVPCPPCNAEPTCKKRVRHRWTTLNDSEKQKFIDAMRVMKETPTPVGKKKYGIDYVSYDEFVLSHAASQQDPRGDQGHYGDVFYIWHATSLLEFENSLLAVDPTIVGLPYWDLRDDEFEIFGPGKLQFGSKPGTGYDYGVVDGAFSMWTVSEYDEHLKEALIKYDAVDYLEHQLDNATGVTRCRRTPVPTSNIVRYPSCSDYVGPFHFSTSDYEACQHEKTFRDFNWCLEGTPFNGAHEFLHIWLGSHDSDQYGFGCPKWSFDAVFAGEVARAGVLPGDYFDISTSMNDPIFVLHHAFIVMLGMDYMHRHPEGAANYWGYHAEKEEGVDNPADGTLLLDVMSSRWPFPGDRLLPNVTNAPTGPMKVWEAICFLGPETAPYTYDIFAHELCEDIAMLSVNGTGEDIAMLSVNGTGEDIAMLSVNGTSSAPRNASMSIMLKWMSALVGSVIAIYSYI